MRVYNFLWYFLIFSFLGWCIEVGFYAVKTGKFVNRGFAAGPICPIYGTGVCLIAWLLGPIDNLLLLFLASAAVATAVELSVGFIMDKIFKSRWWDYSNEKFNLFGYICLRFSVIWGLLCTAAVKLLRPLDYLIGFLDYPIGYVFAALFFFLTVIDLIFSSVRVVRFNRHLMALDRFATGVSEALTRGSSLIGSGIYRGTIRVYREYERVLWRAAKLGVRIIDAFPSFKSRFYNEQLGVIRRRLENVRMKRAENKRDDTEGTQRR